MDMKNKATVRQNRYDKEHTFRPQLKFNLDTDADIKAWIDEVKNLGVSSFQGYIKCLIRTDIANCQNSGMTTEEYLKKLQVACPRKKK